jgi:hypothetical protein
MLCLNLLINVTTLMLPFSIGKEGFFQSTKIFQASGKTGTGVSNDRHKLIQPEGKDSQKERHEKEKTKMKNRQVGGKTSRIKYKQKERQAEENTNRRKDKQKKGLSEGKTSRGKESRRKDKQKKRQAEEKTSNRKELQ